MRFRSQMLLALLFIFLTGCETSNSNHLEIGRSEKSSVYIENKGSDTMVNLALAWAERYQTLRPEISISVTGGGSGTGLTALANGTVDIANASRAIKTEEENKLKAAGTIPFEFVVARDAIAVIVNRNNPINQLSIEQISMLYRGEINNWAELGGENRPVVRLSRETNSGTHVYFLEEVIRQGSSQDKSLFSTDTLLLPSSEGITAEVRDNPNAIGYDGLGYVTPEVKVLAISKNPQGPYILPSTDTVNDQSYPIARDLYMYTPGEPEGAVKAYLEWIMQPEAQKIVNDLGFVPIN